MKSKYDYSFDDLYVKTLESVNSGSFLNKAMAMDFKVYLADDIMAKVDRATMSVTLEGREPFLDHRLIEYAARIPINLKCKNGIRKYILKKILYKYVPREIMERPKQGFVAPISQWLKGDLHPIVKDYLNEDKLNEDGIFDSNAVTSYIKDFYNGVSINVNKIWFLLMFQMWKERWL